MASVRELRKRIRSISNLSQVTRAMEMIAASRMRRAEEQVAASRPYAAKAWELLTQLAAQRALVDDPAPLLMERDPVRAVVLILITADRGLAGGYNAAMVRAAQRFLARQSGRELRLLTVGRKGRDAMARAGYTIEAEFGPLPERPGEMDVAPIARLATDGFLDHASDAVFIGYTDFVNVLRQEAWVRRLLPLRPGELQDPAAGTGGAADRGPVLSRYLRPAPPVVAGGYSYEPAMEDLLEQVVRRFVELQIYQAVVESLASEHAARMMAMRNASENADDLLKDLKMTYNKLRQQSITEEMLDIAGGAEALAAAARR